MSEITTAKVKPILFSGPMVKALLDGRKTQMRRALSPHTAIFSSAPKEFWGHADLSRAFVYCRPELGQYLHVPCHQDEDAGDCGVCRDMGWSGTVHRLWPRIETGDLLWVRETWRVQTWNEDGDIRVSYLADRGEGWVHPDSGCFLERLCDRLDAAGLRGPDGRYRDIPCRKLNRSAIHMPRWASRLTLEVTGVKVERLQEISEEDALAEGAMEIPEPFTGWWSPFAAAALEAIGKAEHVRNPPPQIRFANLWCSINTKRGTTWADNPWVCAIQFRVHQTNIDELLRQREAA